MGPKDKSPTVKRFNNCGGVNSVVISLQEKDLEQRRLVEELIVYNLQSSEEAECNAIVQGRQCESDETEDRLCCIDVYNGLYIDIVVIGFRPCLQASEKSSYQHGEYKWDNYPDEHCKEHGMLTEEAAAENKRRLYEETYENNRNEVKEF